MGGSNKGGPQSSHLKPIRDTDDYRYQALKKGRERRVKRQREGKERRQRYEDQLATLKTEQLETAKGYIESGEVPSPADLLMSMITEQLVTVANPELTTGELNKERELLMKLYDRYDKLTGASAPASQSISVSSSEDEEITPEQVQEELLATTDKLRVIK